MIEKIVEILKDNLYTLNQSELRIVDTMVSETVIFEKYYDNQVMLKFDTATIANSVRYGEIKLNLAKILRTKYIPNPQIGEKAIVNCTEYVSYIQVNDNGDIYDFYFIPRFQDNNQWVDWLTVLIYDYTHDKKYVIENGTSNEIVKRYMGWINNTVVPFGYKKYYTKYTNEKNTSFKLLLNIDIPSTVYMYRHNAIEVNENMYLNILNSIDSDIIQSAPLYDKYIKWTDFSNMDKSYLFDNGNGNSNNNQNGINIDIGSLIDIDTTKGIGDRNPNNVLRDDLIVVNDIYTTRPITITKRELLSIIENYHGFDNVNDFFDNPSYQLYNLQLQVGLMFRWKEGIATSCCTGLKRIIISRVDFNDKFVVDVKIGRHEYYEDDEILLVCGFYSDNELQDELGNPVNYLENYDMMRVRREHNVQNNFNLNELPLLITSDMGAFGYRNLHDFGIVYDNFKRRDIDTWKLKKDIFPFIYIIGNTITCTREQIVSSYLEPKGRFYPSGSIKIKKINYWEFNR